MHAPYGNSLNCHHFSVTFSFRNVRHQLPLPLSERCPHQHDRAQEAGQGEAPQSTDTEHSACLTLSSCSFRFRFFACFSFHFTVIAGVRRRVYQVDDGTWSGSPHGKARAFCGCNSQAFPGLQRETCLPPRSYTKWLFWIITTFPLFYGIRPNWRLLIFPLSLFSIIMKNSWNQEAAVWHKWKLHGCSVTLKSSTWVGTNEIESMQN